MLIKNVSALLGEELDFVSKTDIQINKNLFKKIQPEINSEKNNSVIENSILNQSELDNSDLEEEESNLGNFNLNNVKFN